MKKILNYLAGIAILSLLCYASRAQKPSTELLAPANHALVLIGFERQMAFPIKSISVEELRNNTAIVAPASNIFGIPTVVTTALIRNLTE